MDTMGGQRVVYVVVCAAPPARYVDRIVRKAQEHDWDVCVIATPYALRFIDRPYLEQLTRHPVRSDYKHPDEPDVLPTPHALLVAPATFNTINKWAYGISDTLALGLLTEGIGKGLKLIAVPFVNSAQAAHPAFSRSVSLLREHGVRVLLGPDVRRLHEPGAGGQLTDDFPWDLALAALEE
jgi:phosphopantothenoylcysteine synthetase/decarboxylase